MKKKVFALLAFAVMVFSTCSAFASFPDMEDTSWDWARGAVDEMVEFGIIKGYSDNTFRPGNNITKGEAMVLFSRVIGYTNEDNAPYIEKAKDVYADSVKGLSTPYTGEISYLIYKGVLSEKTFLTYAADGVVDTPMKRYEAAEFLAKIATGNAKLTGSVSQLNFTDNDSINSTMAPYIKYVFENGIMLGMGDGAFDPMGSVTRAQMTVMLSRIIPAIAYEYIDGTVKFYNDATDSLIITQDDKSDFEVALNESALIKLDGKDAVSDALITGSKVRLTFSKDELVAIETISPDYDAVINGRFQKLEKISEDTNGIKIIESSTGVSSTYALSKTVNIIKNDKKITAIDLVADDYVVLTVKEGVVTAIVAESKTKEISGKVTDIKLLPKYTLTVLSDGESIILEVSPSVKLTRNKKNADLENLLVGDSVSITTTYGVATEIVATSKISSAEGTITEVTISATPSITITDANGRAYKYAITRSAAVVQGKTEKSFYDLRVGDKVKLDLDASTVTKVTIGETFETEDSGNGDTTTVSGVVESVDVAYGYIKLKGNESLIFVSKASLQDSTGKEITLKSISAGAKITVFATKQNGSYVASMVVVQK